LLAKSLKILKSILLGQDQDKDDVFFVPRRL